MDNNVNDEKYESESAQLQEKPGNIHAVPVDPKDEQERPGNVDQTETSEEGEKPVGQMSNSRATMPKG